MDGARAKAEYVHCGTTCSAGFFPPGKSPLNKFSIPYCNSAFALIPLLRVPDRMRWYSLRVTLRKEPRLHNAFIGDPLSHFRHLHPIALEAPDSTVHSSTSESFKPQSSEVIVFHPPSSFTLLPPIHK